MIVLYCVIEYCKQADVVGVSDVKFLLRVGLTLFVYKQYYVNYKFLFTVIYFSVVYSYDNM